MLECPSYFYATTPDTGIAVCISQVAGAFIDVESDSDNSMDSYKTSSVKDFSDSLLGVAPEGMSQFTNCLVHYIENNNWLDKLVQQLTASQLH
jgi:hypothetical protein